MNLDESKEVAQRLREEHPQTYAFTDMETDYKKAADTIDALCAEVERLTKVDVEPVQDETHCPHGAELYNYCKLCDMEVSQQLNKDVELSKSVASIYISANGEREFDDWKCDLPIGSTELVPASALAALKQENDELKKEASFLSHLAAQHLSEARAAQADAARMRAKVQELVALLDEATAYTSCASWSPSLTQEMNAATNAARAALETKT